MTDYSKSVIYGIYCKDETVLEFYIGSTYDEKQREKNHKDHWNNENNDKYNYKVYQFIRANGGWDNWKFEVIENYPCENKIELVIQEQYHYDLLNPTLNTKRPYIPEEERKEEQRIRSVKHREDNREQKKIYHAKYRKDNRDKIKEQNKQKHNCECGGKYTHNHKAEHLETNRHKKFLKNQEN